MYKIILVQFCPRFKIGVVKSPDFPLESGFNQKCHMYFLFMIPIFLLLWWGLTTLLKTNEHEQNRSSI